MTSWNPPCFEPVSYPLWTHHPLESHLHEMPPRLQQDAVARMGHDTQWSRLPSSHPFRLVVAPHGRGASRLSALIELIKLWPELAPQRIISSSRTPTRTGLPDVDTRMWVQNGPEARLVMHQPER